MQLIDPKTTDFDQLKKDFKWSIPKHLNIAERVCERHQAAAERVAIYYENVDGETAQYTFAQLKRWSDQFANVLKQRGVSQGDRVAIVLSQRIETIVTHLAVYKLGAIAVPLAILFGPEALEYRLRDSGAKVVVSDACKYKTLREQQAGLSDLNCVIGCKTGELEFWQLLESASNQLDMVDTLADDPACLIYTSGTTGQPKGALIAHRAIIGNFTGFELSQNFFPKTNDVFWTPADWAWTGGLWDALLPSLNYSIPILAYESRKFDAKKVLQLMEKYAVTNTFIPPTALKMLRAVPDIHAYKLKLRAVMSAGEQVGEELIRWGQEVLGVTINEMWGQTEFNYLVGNCSALFAPKPGSMGKAYPGHRVDVIDDQGQVMPTNQHGELAAFCDDPVMFLGYWNKSQAAKEKIIGSWFCTGDIGYRDADGFLWFVGRKDDVISSAGYRIGPGEIEDSLLKHPAVLQAAVIGKPEPLRGEIVKAFIVLAKGFEASDELATEIQQSVKQRLSAHEYPREIEFVASLPMTTTGKVRRMELRQQELRKTQKTQLDTLNP